MRRDLTTSAVAVVVFTLLCGLAYPLLVTGVGQVVFPGRADGSLVERDGEVVGSRLIGQDFRRRPEYFQGRPSATEYAADATFFDNLGPNQRDLADLLRANADAYLALERRDSPGLRREDLPPDAVTASASGIDPHISPANARIQAARVARERGLDRARVLELVDDHTDGRFLFLGEPGVNVLELNLALDSEQP